jgi:hypothetical protein
MRFPNLDLEFKSGEDVAFTLYYPNDDGTPLGEPDDQVTASLAMKEKYSDPSPALTLTKGGGITYNQSTGAFVVYITPAQTASLSFSEGVYDMWVQTSANGKDYVLDGKVIVIPSVA